MLDKKWQIGADHGMNVTGYVNFFSQRLDELDGENED